MKKNELIRVGEWISSTAYTLCSHSLMDRMIGYEPVDPGSIPGESAERFKMDKRLKMASPSTI